MDLEILSRLKHLSNHFWPYERCVNRGNLSKETISNNQYLLSIYN